MDSSQKKREKRYVEKAMELLRESWDIEERERPDFMISNKDTECRFGLEVSELFNGPEGEKGVKEKKDESYRQRLIDSCRNKYEKRKGIPLQVEILGCVNDRLLEELLSKLLQHDFDSMALDEKVEFQIENKCKTSVTKATQSYWSCMDDQAGLVNRNPFSIIAKRVEEKAKKLDDYKNAVGNDVRLLLVANRMYNSGKLAIPEDTQFDIDTCGFKWVYFLSFPTKIHKCKASKSSPRKKS